MREFYRRKGPEYHVWCSMNNRCTSSSNADYGDYGGRGIKVCDRWRNSYNDFLADMGRKASASLSLDRIDNDGDYTPENCRWATKSEQSLNQRLSTRNTSGVRGVSPQYGKYIARPMRDGIRHNLGYYETVEAARDAIVLFDKVRA